MCLSSSHTFLVHVVTHCYVSQATHALLPLCFYKQILCSAFQDLLNLAEVLGEVKKRGLSATQASLLPERKFEATSNPDDNLECMICMCEYEVNDKLRILPCVHEFHSSCIDRWIQVRIFMLRDLYV